MCGIVGYSGFRQAQPLLEQALEKLEYRGYDSWGVAVGGDILECIRDTGRIAERSPGVRLSGHIGIAHTRWASCGAPNRENAHPLTDCSGLIAVAHNGNITNHQEIKHELKKKGHTFSSTTDSEVVAHLIEEHYQGNLTDALTRSLGFIEGSYAIVAMRQGGRELTAARRGSPLVVGLGDNENWLASDVMALADHTGRIIHLEDGDVVSVSPDGVAVTHDGQTVIRPVTQIKWTATATDRGGYRHFMLKEIHEQSSMWRDNAGRWLASAQEPGLARLWGKNVVPPLILGCGSSYYAGLTARYAMEELTGRQVRVELASEFGHRSGDIRFDRLVVGLTQSGETADTLNALRPLKQSGASVVAVTNVAESSVTRLADRTVLMGAGPEVSVAATKTFTAQLGVLYALALGNLSSETAGRNHLMDSFRELPAFIQRVLDNVGEIESAGRWLADYNNVMCIGRGPAYPLAREMALKLKEIAYIHAEACPAGELKHGSLALISAELPVIALFGHQADGSRRAMVTAVREIKARGAPVLALVPGDDHDVRQLVDVCIALPVVHFLFQSAVSASAVQLLAYHTAVATGRPVDRPRHLAKSVTVE
ncbi:glucosamine/fructose-6-phosphate aminotransferase, isomerizing [Dehalogenimonas lykanthroporepellens BL-DC-9]|jgi:glucosamine--fructose-6-phosphate aminotransferase (isomerizing)|nr:glucosamine/fructose-6-phosphate aminotransferase, isomerizing [Dehalogenimonas lykanthroporepellens BL-DC-9]